jgi:hypothetical protein
MAYSFRLPGSLITVPLLGGFDNCKAALRKKSTTSMLHLPFYVYGFGVSFEISGTPGDWPVFQQGTQKFGSKLSNTQISY